MDKSLGSGFKKERMDFAAVIQKETSGFGYMLYMCRGGENSV